METGDSVHRIKCKATLNSVDWNPKFDLIAYATDGDENKTGVAPGKMLTRGKMWSRDFKLICDDSSLFFFFFFFWVPPICWCS